MKLLLLPIGIAILLIAYLGPSSYRKYQMDKEVDRLCSVDGGIAVYEQMSLPESQFDRWGSPIVPSLRRSKPNTPFVLKTLSKEITAVEEGGRSRPILNRFHYQVIRVSDGKILGESIGYGRYGGDPESPFHPSSYGGCTERWNDRILVQKVFTRGTGG